MMMKEAATKTLFGNIPQGVNDYNNETTKKLWNTCPSLMVTRFCLLFGNGNGVSDYTMTERIVRLKRIDKAMATECHASDIYNEDVSV